jgi:hypothetical protein
MHPLWVRVMIQGTQLLKYHVNILLVDFNAKVKTEDIFKPTVGNEILYEIHKFCHIKKSNCEEYSLSTLQHSQIHLAYYRWENIQPG